MIIEYKRSAAYICPFCSEITIKNLTPFNFSGSNTVKYICSTHGCREECGKTTLKGNRYKTDIECPICGEVHSFSTKYNNFWHNANIIYKCPNSDVSIFFIGNDENVKKFPEKMLAEYNDIFDFFEKEPDISPMLLDMLDCINVLDKKRKISCECGSHDIICEIENNELKLTCQECGSSRIIEANEENLAILLNAEAITIEN